MNREQLYAMRRKMGMLYQFGALFTDMSALENVAFQIREHTSLPEDMVQDLALMKLNAVGLRGAHHLMPAELSGGMARRVALARAIALDPMLILYDEPFTALDPISFGVISRLIRELNGSLGATSIIVTHDVQEALGVVDYVYFMAAGRIIAKGTPDEIRSNHEPFVNQFVNGKRDGPVPFHYPAPDYAGDLELAVRRWVERAGLRSALFLTLTVPHDYGEELPDVLADVRAGWSQVIGGRSRQRLKTRYGLRHLVRSHDVTVGRAGWHPHLHAVLLLDAPLDDAAVIRLRGELITSWRLAITARGRRAPTEANGIGLEVVRSLDDIAGYVVQLQADGTPRKKRLALEVTRGDLKRSRHLGQRTPWELLADYSAAPNAGDLHLWRAWEKATKGVHAIQWSRGLRAAVELAPAGGPAPDTVLEDGEETVARFTWDAWRPIAFRMGRLAELLDTAEARGEIGIYRLVRAFARHDASAAGREGPAREMRPHLLAMMRADFAELDRRAYTLELQERERRELQRAELNRWRRRFGYETIPPAEGASPGSGPAPLEPCGSRLASGEADSRE